ncbi:DUF2809 domain-containing protein [Pseudoalteromonas luteoviolacea]|uniref:DUF2809 domain-containing protein n=1 Tax=Pseudoalteromonas luteoviolacea S4054 TaxID=1129367 RepID=A0A0F6AAT5_9GAMM|nr:DUF2809 domain-containing protein [Pseudoalteromonas luteoviolacea]AOT08665.1 hypothetical protein S4054249_12725 [Pseudoalteromonas luteoviolacea]AOT13580.1 hypothetical protein S40542_12700 [Pseudoalteromonas luteoviolacea]AOT18493.1 hypothetical protein S4054_12700 [Pseudoalteromonas luteoviolacea]KKE82504.1 hypothetical protein N479_18020 [Pseudoalteromonas luteoviolacea S4054]KZN72041.1 hypothetical protein N481_16655 [Pseudoalteromonas luteoviolacea S4047-1]
MNKIKATLTYSFFSLITMGLGLFSRADIIEFPVWVSLYLGDFLWALMVFWLMCALKPSMSNRCALVIACLFCFSIELSQLYQGSWLNSIRQTWLGGLVLGFGFKFSDLMAYSLGIVFGVYVKHILRDTIKINTVLK